VEVAWERRNPPKALKSFCPFVRPGRGTREKPVLPVACRQDRQKPLTFSAKPCRIAATLRSAPLLLGGPLLLVAAFPYSCFAVIEVAPPALPQPPATRPVPGLHATDTTHRSSRNSLRHPLRWTSQPGGVVWTPVLPRPRRIPVESSRHPFRSVFLASAPPGRPDDTNATALQRPCGPPPWHGGKHSYLRHSPRLQRPPALTWAEPGHHPGGCTPSPFSNDLLSNRVTSAAPLLGRGTDDTSRASQPAVVCNRHSPPLCSVGSPVDFGGQNAEAPPYPPSKFPSLSAPSFSSVTASPFMGFAPLSYSRSAFSADTRSCQTGWGCHHPPGSRQRQTLNEPITRTFTPIASWALVRTPSGGFASGCSRTRTS
jgi:hypothetical protein